MTVHLRRRVVFALGTIIPTLLTGCALTSTAKQEAAQGAAMAGGVHGGSQPVVGAHVHVLSASASGYGAAATSLLTTGIAGMDTIGGYVATDANGSFSITGDYTCVAGTQIYVLATGGNPGLPNNQVNPNLALMSAVGECPATGTFAATVPYIWVNEASTVASVYALSGFMTDLTHIGSSGTPLAQTAIANAFATVANLVGVSTGAALATTPAGNGTPPQAELNTLANILASCVNSAGTGSASCTILFANAKNGSVQPVDTVTAALNIAHNPAANISNLFALQAAAGAPYQPTLSAAPNDFTVSVVYSGGGMNAPLAIAIDGVGDVWMVNSGASTLSKLNGVTGAAISPSTGFTGGGLNAPFSLAIDTSGNAWTINPRVTNRTTGATVNPASLSEFSSTGVPASGSPFSGGGLTISDSATSQSLRALAFDGNGNLWVANNASLSVSEFNGLNGQPLSPAFGYPLGSSNVDPDGIAVDSAQHVWVSGLYGNMLYEVSVPTGAVLFTSGSTSGFFEPNSIAIDASNDLWLTDQSDPAAQNGTVVSEFNASGGALGEYAGGGVLGPEGVAIDGSGNVWISNDLNGSVSELSNSGSPLSPSTGFMSASLPQPADIAIDLSGNVWVPNVAQPVSLPNGGTTVVNGTTVTEFVGAASPTVTPLAAAVAGGKLGARP